MKITFNKQQPEFTPVQMAVDIETLEDAKAWYAISTTIQIQTF